MCSVFAGRGTTAVVSAVADDREVSGTPPPPLEPAFHVQTSHGLMVAPTGVARNLLEAFELSTQGPPTDRASSVDVLAAAEHESPPTLVVDANSSDVAVTQSGLSDAPTALLDVPAATTTPIPTTGAHTAASAIPANPGLAHSGAVTNPQLVIPNAVVPTTETQFAPHALAPTMPLTGAAPAAPVTLSGNAGLATGVPAPAQTDFGIGLMFPPPAQGPLGTVQPGGFGALFGANTPLAPAPVAVNATFGGAAPVGTVLPTPAAITTPAVAQGPAGNMQPVGFGAAFGANAPLVPAPVAVNATFGGAAPVGTVVATPAAAATAAVATAAVVPPIGPPAPMANPLPVQVPGPAPGLMANIRALFDCVSEVPDAILM